MVNPNELGMLPCHGLTVSTAPGSYWRGTITPGTLALACRCSVPRYPGTYLVTPGQLGGSPPDLSLLYLSYYLVNPLNHFQPRWFAAHTRIARGSATATLTMFQRLGPHTSHRDTTLSHKLHCMHGKAVEWQRRPPSPRPPR